MDHSWSLKLDFDVLFSWCIDRTMVGINCWEVAIGELELGVVLEVNPRLNATRKSRKALQSGMKGTLPSSLPKDRSHVSH